MWMRIQSTDPRQPQSSPSNTDFEVLLKLVRSSAKDHVPRVVRVADEIFETVDREYIQVGEG
jgi:hypothetical protein